MTGHILLTFDIEDWFQVENLKACIPFSSWGSHELRVEKITHRILDLLDSWDGRDGGDLHKREDGTDLDHARNQVGGAGSVLRPGTKITATFFVLGWVAKRLPQLVREIHSRHHEIASHGYHHRLCTECTAKDLRSDLTESRKLLEDLIGEQVYGYRAPSFAVNEDILKTIEECGYSYDSSWNTFALHGRYGKVNLSGRYRKGIAFPVSKGFFELPISNIKMVGQTLPWGGGGYFRLMPLPFFRLGVRWILRKEKAYVFYMHPWEMDPGQPRVNGASKFHRFRHYVNLCKTHSKFSEFLGEVKECQFLSCQDYIEQIVVDSKGV